MILRYDPEVLWNLILKLEDMSSALDYMHTNIIKIQEKIELENKGMAIDKIIGIKIILKTIIMD